MKKKLKDSQEVAAGLYRDISLEEVRQRLIPMVSHNTPDPALEYNLPAVTLALLNVMDARALEEDHHENALQEMTIPFATLPKPKAQSKIINPVRPLPPPKN